MGTGFSGARYQRFGRTKEEQAGATLEGRNLLDAPIPASLVFGAFGALKHVLTAALLGR
jgi:hypothetical protein